MKLGMCNKNDYYVLPPLQGKLVLEIGCNFGWLASHIVKQDPARYLGIDIWPPECSRKVGQSPELYSRFQYGNILDRETLPYDQHWDVVIMFGVLYHLIEPLRALINLRDFNCEMIVLGTAYHRGSGTFMHFEPGYNGDDTNFWYPSRGCLEKMFRWIGYTPEVKYIWKESEVHGFFHDRICIHGRKLKVRE